MLVKTKTRLVLYLKHNLILIGSYLDRLGLDSMVQWSIYLDWGDNWLDFSKFHTKGYTIRFGRPTHTRLDLLVDSSPLASVDDTRYWYEAHNPQMATLNYQVAAHCPQQAAHDT